MEKPIFPRGVKKLRDYGHGVCDFRNPPHNHDAFMRKDVDTFVYIPEMQEAELMYKLFDLVSGERGKVIE